MEGPVETKEAVNSKSRVEFDNKAADDALAHGMQIAAEVVPKTMLKIERRIGPQPSAWTASQFLVVDELLAEAIGLLKRKGAIWPTESVAAFLDRNRTKDSVHEAVAARALDLFMYASAYRTYQNIKNDIPSVPPIAWEVEWGIQGLPLDARMKWIMDKMKERRLLK